MFLPSLILLNAAKGGIKMNFDNQAVSDTGAFVRAYTAGIRINNDGTAEKLVNSTYSDTNAGDEWARPLFDATGYYVRATENSVSGLTSNTTKSGPTRGDWHALSTNRTWSYSVASGFSGLREWNITIDIATDSGGANIVASADISLRVEYTP